MHGSNTEELGAGSTRLLFLRKLGYVHRLGVDASLKAGRQHFYLLPSSFTFTPAIMFSATLVALSAAAVVSAQTVRDHVDV
jgi:hypothetical protein